MPSNRTQYTKAWPIYRKAVELRMRTLTRLRQYLALGGLMHYGEWHSTRVEAAYSARMTAQSLGWEHPNIVDIDRKIHDAIIAKLWCPQ